MQTLDAAIKTVPKDRNGKISKEYLRVALDIVAPSAGLPPFGALDEVLFYPDHNLKNISYLPNEKYIVSSTLINNFPNI